MEIESKSRRGAKATEAQKISLIEFLQHRLDLANDRFKTADAAHYRDSEWSKLSVRLNALGGAIKNGMKWRKYWKDLTISVRSRENIIKEDRRKSVIDGFIRKKKLSEIDQKILSIITSKAQRVDLGSASDTSFEQINDAHNESLVDLGEEEEELLEEVSGYSQASPSIHFTSKSQTWNRSPSNSTDDPFKFCKQTGKKELKGAPGCVKEIGFDFCEPKEELEEADPSSSPSKRLSRKRNLSDSNEEDPFKQLGKRQTMEEVSGLINEFDLCKPKTEFLEEASESRPASPPIYSERFEEAVPSSSTSKKQKRKKTLSDSTDDVFKFYKEMELKKIKLKERKIEVMEESNRIQIEIKTKIDQLLQLFQK